MKSDGCWWRVSGIEWMMSFWSPPQEVTRVGEIHRHCVCVYGLHTHASRAAQPTDKLKDTSLIWTRSVCTSFNFVIDAIGSINMPIFLNCNWHSRSDFIEMHKTRHFQILRSLYLWTARNIVFPSLQSSCSSSITTVRGSSVRTALNFQFPCWLARVNTLGLISSIISWHNQLSLVFPRSGRHWETFRHTWLLPLFLWTTSPTRLQRYRGVETFVRMVWYTLYTGCAIARRFADEPSFTLTSRKMFSADCIQVNLIG